MEAFYGVNRSLLFTESSSSIIHRFFLEFETSPLLDEEVDYTKLVNYTASKWSSLVSNYLDFSDLDKFEQLVSQRIGTKRWSIGFKFSHNTVRREACLMTATAVNNGTGNYLVVDVRTSEVYKRLALDLLLFKRIGDRVYKDTPYIIKVYIRHAWLSKDWASMLLVNRSWRKSCSIANPGTFAEKVLEQYRTFKSTEWEQLSYNSHKRPCRVIQGDIHTKRLISSDCII